MKFLHDTFLSRNLKASLALSPFLRPPTKTMGGLAKAKKVVQATMRHQGAKLLFNEAVDTTLLPDYAKIISRPMDLGKILQRLSEDYYSSPKEVRAWYCCSPADCGPNFKRCQPSMRLRCVETTASARQRCAVHHLEGTRAFTGVVCKYDGHWRFCKGHASIAWKERGGFMEYWTSCGSQVKCRRQSCEA